MARVRGAGGRFVSKTKSSGSGKRRKSGGGHAPARGGALVVVKETVARRPAARRTVHHTTHHAKRKGRRRRHSGDGGTSLMKIGGAAAVLANVAGKNDGVLGSTVYDLVQKLPGAKTFGGAVTAGAYLGMVHRFTNIGGSFRPWLRAAGLIGVVGIGLKLGEMGANIKWLGAPGGPFEIERS